MVGSLQSSSVWQNSDWQEASVGAAQTALMLTAGGEPVAVRQQAPALPQSSGPSQVSAAASQSPGAMHAALPVGPRTTQQMSPPVQTVSPHVIPSPSMPLSGGPASAGSVPESAGPPSGAPPSDAPPSGAPESGGPPSGGLVVPLSSAAASAGVAASMPVGPPSSSADVSSHATAKHARRRMRARKV